MARKGPKYFSGSGRLSLGHLRIKGRNRPALTLEQATIAEAIAAAKRKRKAEKRLAATIAQRSTEMSHTASHSDTDSDATIGQTDAIPEEAQGMVDYSAIEDKINASYNDAALEYQPDE